jgi:hypothetical protein
MLQHFAIALFTAFRDEWRVELRGGSSVYIFGPIAEPLGIAAVDEPVPPLAILQENGQGRIVHDRLKPLLNLAQLQIGVLLGADIADHARHADDRARLVPHRELDGLEIPGAELERLARPFIGNDDALLENLPITGLGLFGDRRRTKVSYRLAMDLHWTPASPLSEAAIEDPEPSVAILEED